MKRILLAILSLVLLCSCSKGVNDDFANADTLKAAVLTDSPDKSVTYSQLENSLIATLEVEAVPTDTTDFSSYDMVFTDGDMSGNVNKSAIESYVRGGGSVFIENSLYDDFDKDFIGASDFVKIDKCPSVLDCPDNGGDLKKIQELLCDFTNTYKDYKNFDALSKKDYGYGVITSDAKSVASSDGVSLYTMNNYGNGYVFFTNPILPNVFSVNDLTPDNEGEYLSNTTIGANILLRSMFAEFVSIKKYGYAVWRTFGSFGTKPAAWELHYEDITGIANKSAEIFDKMCRESYQFPSYTLARNAYVWFERAESVTCLEETNGKYEPYAYENAYSSGSHFVSAKEWLQIDNYEKTESYFEYDGRYTKRAYPCLTDFDKDGKTDVICGSANGGLYLYTGLGKNENYEFGVSTVLTDTEGNAIGVDAYSSPALCDIDSDGIEELLCGSEEGDIYCFKPVRGCAFENQGIILHTGLTDSMIDTGDLNGDGIADLAVGSRTGEMRVYYGEKWKYGIKFDQYISVETELDRCAPCISDGLYAGTGEGYIAKFEKVGDTYKFNGYLDSDKTNYKGNKHLKFGENCVPRFYDIDKDGKKELVAGQLEYGMAYPIDSTYFPYRNELQEQADYCKENHIYLGAHSLMQKHADRDTEMNELAMHKKAFESYGITWDGMGANQHTWFTSEVGYDGNYDNREGYDGTYRSQYESGLLWNSGSQTPHSSAVPQISAENSMAVPFYLFGKMLMLQPSSTPYGESRYSDISTKYELPMLFYNHCDYVYNEHDNQQEQIDKVDKDVTDNNYTFVREDQMAKSIAASYNTRVYAKREDDKIVLKAETKDKKIPLYDKNFAQCTGVKVVFGADENITEYSSDADVWHEENHGIYVSLDKKAEVVHKSYDKMHITAVNSPARITSLNGITSIKFVDGGIMQVFVEGNASTTSEGWNTVERNGQTMFVKYGDASVLKIEE